eukprot:gnl/TRDRNA2_/TRDRNA2_182671_c0_seq1.p1 gnl/TRDRNA2_/TRDRNA2_182671_c0~~gnl/TRDRNA2_/TRDRNA2_182671_c0_seq1.p1  ORF type:complete len:415 (+),score=143.77 gnl/TRDRNA2_/TRDRNA2_182671_c0_seq1:66-1247(+)
MARTEVHDDLAQFDEEEPDIRGSGEFTMTFRPAVEVLPKTKRTEELQKRKIEELKRKREAAENLRKEKEKEEAMKRQREQQQKKQMQLAEQRRKEEERKRREEEEQRKKMEGGLDQILDALMRNVSASHITVCGIELSSVRLRLLTKAMEGNYSCMSLDLSRKGLCDEDGLSLAGMLEKNLHLQKLECEGNNLGKKAAEAIGEALKTNESLRALNLESNNLTASGNDQTGIIELANALKVNKSLRVLQLAKNGITAQAGEYFVKAIEANESLILVDLSGNDPSLSVEQLRRIDAAVRRNRERHSALRRAERRERFTLYNEEFKCRQHYMQVEAMRLEIEAHEERRLNRMKARFEKWSEDIKKAAEDEDEKFIELMTEAADRAEGNKGKKKKKG